MNLVFQLKIRNTSPTFGNGCIQLLRSFFNCMTSSCAQTSEILLLFHSVMSVNVFVWVLSRADECVSNRMHLKMISQSHKWENNKQPQRKKKFVIFILFSSSFVIIIISCETIEEYYSLFEQFTVWPGIGVCADVWLWLCAALYYITLFSSDPIIFCALFFQLCVNRFLMSATFFLRRVCAVVSYSLMLVALFEMGIHFLIFAYDLELNFSLTVMDLDTF